VIAALVLVGALLLVWAGAAKAARPDGTARALRAAGLPSRPVLVRALATFEAAVGLAAVIAGGFAVDAVMAGSYAALAVFVWLALRRRWALSSCGCFGVADAPPTASHVVVSATLAIAAAVAAASGTGRAWVGFTRHPAQGLALGMVALVSTGLVVLLLSRLPALAAAGRSS
jgi:hypothetical protein